MPTSPLPGQCVSKTPAGRGGADEACPRRTELVSRDLSQRRSAGFFEERDRLLPRDTGKVIEELFQRIASLQVVEEGANRNARSDEHRRSAVNLGIGMNDGSKICHASSR